MCWQPGDQALLEATVVAEGGVTAGGGVGAWELREAWLHRTSQGVCRGNRVERAEVGETVGRGLAVRRVGVGPRCAELLVEISVCVRCGEAIHCRRSRDVGDQIAWKRSADEHSLENLNPRLCGRHV